MFIIQTYIQTCTHTTYIQIYVNRYIKIYSFSSADERIHDLGDVGSFFGAACAAGWPVNAVVTIGIIGPVLCCVVCVCVCMRVWEHTNVTGTFKSMIMRLDLMNI